MSHNSPADSRVPLPPLTSGPHRGRLGLISVVACLGGPLFGVVALILVITQVPETRARSLEDLEEDVSTGAIYQVARSADAHQS